MLWLFLFFEISFSRKIWGSFDLI
jgi:hypothetical protein